MQLRKKVLVVEDETDIQEIIRYLLTESGYQVGQCPNAEQFLSELQHLDPDLILMDVMLPDGNGIELCRIVKENPVTSHIPVIIMSAHYNPRFSDADWCGDDFMEKPFDIYNLLKKVDQKLSA